MLGNEGRVKSHVWLFSSIPLLFIQRHSCSSLTHCAADGGEAVDVSRFGSTLSPTRCSLIFKEAIFTNQRNTSIFQCVCVCNVVWMHVESLQNQWCSQEYCSGVKNSSWVCYHTHFYFVLQTKLFFHHFLCPLLWCVFFFYSNPLNSLDLFINSSDVSLWNQVIYPVTQITRSSEYGVYVECET